MLHLFPTLWRNWQRRQNPSAYLVLIPGLRDKEDLAHARQECLRVRRWTCLNTDGESFLRIVARAAQREPGSVKNPLEHGREHGLQFEEGGFFVRGVEPVVGDNQQVVSAETKPSSKAGLVFQQAAALKCGLQNRDKAVVKAAGGGLFAVVEKTHSPVSHIDAEISLVSHEQNARSLVNVTVVVDIDKKVLLHNLSLDPGMKDRNELRHLRRRWFRCEELNSKSIYVHQR